MEEPVKSIWKKNQIIITGLVLMFGVVGYFNFTEKSVKETLNWQKDQTSAEKEEVAKQEQEETTTQTENKKKKKTQATDQETDQVGEAVLTSATGNEMMYSVKLKREQTRAESKEMLTEIINNANATEQQKNDAISSIMELAEFSEKENAAETLLSAKGFEDSVVSMSKDGVDVVVAKEKLSEQELAQVEDIVSRKTGVTMEKVVISTAQQQAEEKSE